MFATTHTAAPASAFAWRGAVPAHSKRSRSAVCMTAVVQAELPVNAIGDGVHTEDPAP
jgi:hypothetical protein